MTEIIHTPLTVLHVVACVFLILVILIQPGKSGGMGVFGAAGAQQVFGGRGAGNFLTKTTWATAAVFFSTSITLAYLSSSSDETLAEKAREEMQKRMADKPGAPATPSPASPK
jgi:preprotein translocase subunit SecG